MRKQRMNLYVNDFGTYVIPIKIINKAEKINNNRKIKRSIFNRRTIAYKQTIGKWIKKIDALSLNSINIY